MANLSINIMTYLYEIDTNIAFESVIPEFRPISRFPAVRRDLAVLLDERISSESLTKEVIEAAGPMLRDVRIFDVYRGGSIDSSLKSVALGLILQETSRTLTDDDADGVVKAVISRLERKLQARIRD